MMSRADPTRFAPGGLHPPKRFSFDTRGARFRPTSVQVVLISARAGPPPPRRWAVAALKRDQRRVRTVRPVHGSCINEEKW